MVIGFSYSAHIHVLKTTILIASICTVSSNTGVKLFSEIAKTNLYHHVLFRPRHAKTCFMASVGSESPDKPAHPRSLIRAFSVR